ncbi:MAG: VOC family protein [Burkholderiaceae bacterium]|nr:VOC family protein [Burkholderiaceae bacterium]
MRFHHFGLAVHTPEDAFRYLAALGYTEGAVEYDPLQRVNVAMRHHAHMPDVEVIWPQEKPSPIDNIIKGRDSMIYHLCYCAPDAEATLRSLEQAGLQVHTVSEPKPAVLFGGLPVSFHLVSGIGVIELIHGTPGSP